MDIEIEEEEGLEEVEVGKKEKEDELGDIPPEDADFLKRSKRFKEVYGKWKGTERELAKLKEDSNSSKTLISEMSKHNKALVEAMRSSVKEIAADRNVKSEQEEIASALKQLDENVASLVGIKAEAMKEQDFKKVAEIDETLAELRDKKREYKAYVPKKAEDKPDLSPFDGFREKASWYDEDPIMRVAAQTLDDILAEDSKWKNKPVEDRLEEVRIRIEKRFGYKKDDDKDEDLEDKGTPKKKTPDGLDSGGGNRVTPGQKVKLTREQLQVAEGLGLTPQEYAEQLVMIGGGKR